MGLAGVLPPACQRFWKMTLPWVLFSILGNLFVPFKQGSSRGAASGGSDFWKIALPCEFCQFWRNLLRRSSRGLAGVLPPAGQIFEKWYFLNTFYSCLTMFVMFKQGVGRGAASGGSDFWKMTLPLNSWTIFPNFFAIFKQGASRGAASGGSHFWKITPSGFCFLIFRAFCDFQAGC